MDLQPTLENDLVMLRPMKENDLEPLYLVASDPLIWDQHRFKRHIRSEFEKFFDECILSKGALVIIDKLNNQIIGSSRYMSIQGFPNGLEIGGTFMAREYWGKAYNGTIKKLMLEYALQFVEYVLFYVHKDNVRSQRAVEKLNGLKISASEFTEIPQKSEDHLRYLVCSQCGPNLKFP